MAPKTPRSSSSVSHYPSNFTLHSDRLEPYEEASAEESGDGPIPVQTTNASGSRGTGKATDPCEFNEDIEAKILPLAIRYRGYLKAVVDIRATEVQQLEGGEALGDRMIDFLLAHAHAVQYERRRDALSRVIIFPTAFGERLMALSLPNIKEDDGLKAVQRQLAMYKLEEIWSAALLLAPIHLHQHWVLVAVTNPFRAVSQESGAPETHNVLPGESKPDREPFTILLLNSAPQYVPKTIVKAPTLMRRFLEFSWCKHQSSTLEFVNWYSVRCPEQFDSVSCGLHAVHNAEILMREGVAEMLRKAAQGVVDISQSEWNDIFEPSIITNGAYWKIKVGVMRQEIAIYQVES